MKGVTLWHQRWWIVSPLSILTTIGCLSIRNASTHTQVQVSTGANHSAIKQDSIGERTEIPTNAPSAAAPSNVVPVEMTELMTDNYVVPKSAINCFHTGSHWWQTSSLDEEFSTAMGLNKEQTRHIGEAISSTLDKLATLEAEHSTLVSDAAGDQFFVIGTFDGSGLKKQLRDQIQSIAAGGPSEFLADALLRDPTFGGFGSFPQEFAVEEIATPGGGTLSGINVKFKHDINGISRGYFSTNVEMIQKRFAPIYAKAGLTLPLAKMAPENR